MSCENDLLSFQMQDLECQGELDFNLKAQNIT